MGGMKRGITLPEILVAMGLLGLLTGLVYPVMYATVRAMQRSDADVRSQQKAVLLIQKFFADFAYTNRGSMMTLETPPAASFLSRESLRESSGLPPLVPDEDYVTSRTQCDPVVWRKFVLLYLDTQSHQLQRLDLAYPGGTFLGCMTPVQLHRLVSDPRYQSRGRKVIDGVDSLSVRATGESSLCLTLVSKQAFDLEKTTRLQVVLSARN